MWNSSHYKLTENWQKDSYTTKAERKIHMESEREEKQSGWDLCPREWTHSEERGDYTGGHPPWEVSGSSHILGTPALGYNTGKTSHLGCLEGQWD